MERRLRFLQYFDAFLSCHKALRNVAAVHRRFGGIVVYAMQEYEAVVMRLERRLVPSSFVCYLRMRGTLSLA
jgi:hypothetical protein